MAMKLTYCRKPTVMGQCYQNEAEQGSITAAESPFISRLDEVPPPPSSRQGTRLLEADDDEDKSQIENRIKAGYLYEIDHIHLPARTPVQLRAIQVAMVCEKTEMNVAIRFPSMESLRAFFNYSTRITHPALDEKFVMSMALACKVLLRVVPAEVFSEQKSSEAFWLIRPSASESFEDNLTLAQKKGSCLSELKSNGMVRWGVRRQVKYLGRHKESDGNDVHPQNSSSSFVNGVEGSRKELGAARHERESTEDGGGLDVTGDGGDEDNDDDKENDEGEEDDEENGDDPENERDDEEVEEDKIKETNKNMKRKRYSFRTIGVKKPKQERVEIKKRRKQKQKKPAINKNKGRTRFKEELAPRDPKNRWSAERYKLAEQNLLRVMKAKGATAEKPILRPQLRAEARKKIGDTGLLDHLLKHMAGKLAPGGEERFRRRHNPDGAMEYWLESADLVNIRRDAGVTDPYWVPPPGWKPGDSPTQDPICARELRLLKDDISKINRDMESMVTKMQLEEEIGKLRRELDEIASQRRKEENQANTMAYSPSDVSRLVNSRAASKCDLDHAQVSVEKRKKQLMAISYCLKEIEEKIGKLAPNLEEPAAKDTSLMVPTETHKKEEQPVARKPKRNQPEVQALIAAGAETSKLGIDQNEGQTVAAQKAAETEKTAAGSPAAAAAAEEKAAKIQRLKSGFRICKPQGTFLWPNMVKGNSSNSSPSKTMSPQLVVQVEVPTPPSVSSSTASAPPQLPYHHQHPVSLVKPLAEKRAVTVTVSTAPKGQNNLDGPNSYSTATSLINLNDAPKNPNTLPVAPTARTVPWENAASGPGNTTGSDQREYNAYCSSPTTSLPSVAGNCLALSAFKCASDDSGHD